MKYKFTIVAIGRSFQSYPYLAKLNDVLSSLGSVSYLHWDRDAGHSPLEEWVIFSFRPKSFIGLIFGYLLWVLKLLYFFTLKADRETIYFCSRLDAAYPAYLACLIGLDIKYVYLDRDAYHMTYNLGLFKGLIKFIERCVASKAVRHFVPGESRNFTGLPNVCVINNTPNADFLSKAKIISNEKDRDSRFVIYINGWLAPTRGAKFMLSACRVLDPMLYVVYVAGPIECEAISDMIKLDVVKYLGQLVNIEALAYYFLCDVVLSFYDPSIEINKNAEPNKWCDCAFTGTVFITNSGIETYKIFKKDGCNFLIDYGDSSALLNIISYLNNKKNEGSLNIEPYYKDLNMDFWDERVKSISRNL